jgi:glycerol-3-phosphate dehydrogenase
MQQNMNQTPSSINTSHPSPLPTSRSALLTQLTQPKQYDLAVIGGGATGLGIALDAASRGFSVVLLESEDFAKGTSSRSTKLVHGGVRYLAQGNISLVQEALHERATILRNAPHLAQPLAFLMPCYKYWEIPFFAAGLVLYDALAGKRGLGRTKILGAKSTQDALDNIRHAGLKGSVQYWDGQFDDARLSIALARTAAQHGALLVNYCKVTDLIHVDGTVTGLRAEDRETGQAIEIKANCVINATGVWVDAIRQLEQAQTSNKIKDMIAPSQGVHIVVDKKFLPGDRAIIVPHTTDGRVLFAVPWLGKVIIGTTDTPRNDLSREPDPFKEELDFILNESARYLNIAPTQADILSIWVGLRPLVKPAEDDGLNTKKISREHTVLVSPGKLVTVTGGKWTTYRAMAHDALKQCFAAGLLPERSQSQTENLPLVGAQQHQNVAHPMSQAPGLAAYGDEANTVRSLPGAEHELGGGLTEAMVRFAGRYEYARRVEDVLARRSRLLFLDAKLAESMAAKVGAILQEETGIDPEVDAFIALAKHYQPQPAA